MLYGCSDDGWYLRIRHIRSWMNPNCCTGLDFNFLSYRVCSSRYLMICPSKLRGHQQEQWWLQRCICVSQMNFTCTWFRIYILHKQTASFRLAIGSLQNIAAVEVLGAGGKGYLIPSATLNELNRQFGRTWTKTFYIMWHYILWSLTLHLVVIFPVTNGLTSVQRVSHWGYFSSTASRPADRWCVVSLHANCYKIGWLALHTTLYIDNLWSQLQTKCYCDNFIHHVFYLHASKFLVNIIAMSSSTSFLWVIIAYMYRGDCWNDWT